MSSVVDDARVGEVLMHCWKMRRVSRESELTQCGKGERTVVDKLENVDVNVARDAEVVDEGQLMREKAVGQPERDKMCRSEGRRVAALTWTTYSQSPTPPACGHCEWGREVASQPGAELRRAS